MDREIDWLTSQFSELGTESDESNMLFVYAAEAGELATVARLFHSGATRPLREALAAAVCAPVPPLDVIDFLLRYSTVDRELFFDAVEQSTLAVVQRLTHHVDAATLYDACDLCIHEQNVADPNVYWYMTGVHNPSPLADDEADYN